MSPRPVVSARECPPGVFLALPDDDPAGRPLAVKDLFDTAGLTTTYGSALFAEQDVDGALVGGASLEAASFWKIVAAATSAR